MFDDNSFEGRVYFADGVSIPVGRPSSRSEVFFLGHFLSIAVIHVRQTVTITALKKFETCNSFAEKIKFLSCGVCLVMFMFSLARLATG